MAKSITSPIPTDNLAWWWDFDIALDSDADTVPDRHTDPSTDLRARRSTASPARRWPGAL